MKYKQFAKRLKESICAIQIQEESECRGHSIILSKDGKVFVDFKQTELASLDEAAQYINQIALEEEIVKDLYEDIPPSKIANIIREHHSIKVTSSLIESYVQLAVSKTFSIDPVIYEIRLLNSMHSLIENKIDYKLQDGSIVAISEETQLALASLLDDKYELVEYMRESKSNFMYVLKELS